MESSKHTNFPNMPGFISRLCQLSIRRMLSFGMAIYHIFAYPRFVFSVAAVSVLSSKGLHMYLHWDALTSASLTQWSLSCFAQDTAILLVLRLLLDTESGYVSSWALRMLAISLASLVASIQLAIATINITFFLVIGSEPRWRNVGIITDSSTWATFAEGIPTCMMTVGFLLFISFALTNVTHFLFSMALDVIKASLDTVLIKLRIRGRNSEKLKYSQLPPDEDEDCISEGKCPTPPCSNRQRWTTRVLHVATGVVLAVQIITAICRPSESILAFLSWTSVAQPIVENLSTASPLAELVPIYNMNITQRWDQRTAREDTNHPAGLSNNDNSSQGFSDWYKSWQPHYSADLDPLNQNNIKDEVIAPLRGKLSDIDIRHVVVILLESTRHDVFPFKKDGFIGQKLAESWSENGSLPEAVQNRLATLTTTANLLTGDFNDGFEHNNTTPRGGINAVHATPSATYTLKSCTGILCGINPLAADGNHEYRNHIYQPCLPQMFNLFNQLQTSSDTTTGRQYAGYGWNNSFLMSVTGQYDNQYQLMEAIGFADEDLIDAEYLGSDHVGFAPPDRSWLNYQGWEEEPLEEYITDAFKTAREQNTRLFLTHLTSSAHYPYQLPETDKYVPLVPEDGSGHVHDISKYLNAIGYVDRWVGRILTILEEQDAMNETLVVLVGDHGIPLAETGGVSPWGIPNIGSFRVPLVFSHPKLPAIDIQESVTAMSIAPTILDLLVETGSLSHIEQQVAQKLLHNYEAPSLIRSLQRAENDTEKRWQFTSVSPGGQRISTRSMDEPRWRLIVPLIEDTEWRFSDLEGDRHEDDPINIFGFAQTLEAIERKHGIEAAKWAEEAAFAARWWVEENHQLWKYNPSKGLA